MTEIKQKTIELVERMPDEAMFYVFRVLKDMMPLLAVKEWALNNAKFIAAEKQLSEGQGTAHELIEA